MLHDFGYPCSEWNLYLSEDLTAHTFLRDSPLLELLFCSCALDPGPEKAIAFN